MRFSFTRLVVCNVVGFPLAELAMVEGSVLALHGDNGAGKTSLLAMLMAVMVPDPRRIDHAVRGSSTTKLGLAGRVCLRGAPSYAFVEAHRGTSCMYFGVQFRESAGPLPAAVSFLVEGLPPGLPAADLLLRTSEPGGQRFVAALDHVRQAAGRFGGSLREFSRETDYYAALDELGVLPSALSSRLDRDQWSNIYLFGFGRRPHELVAGLKDYLLAEDDTLRSGVETMDASFRTVVDCRRRIERYRVHTEALSNLWREATLAIAGAVAAVRADCERFDGESERLSADIGRLQADIERAQFDESGADAAVDELEAVATDAESSYQAARDAAVARSRDLAAAATALADAAARARELGELRLEVGRSVAGLADLRLLHSVVGRRVERLTITRARLEAGHPAAPDHQPHSIPTRHVSGTTRGLALEPLTEHPMLRDLEAEEAARMEAALGPAAGAFLTNDPLEAAGRLLADRAVIADVWLIHPDGVAAEIGRAAGTMVPGGAIVRENGFVRASAPPAHLRFGTRARVDAAARLEKVGRLLRSLAVRIASLRDLGDRMIRLMDSPEAAFAASDISDGRASAAKAFERAFDKAARVRGRAVDLDEVADEDRPLLQALVARQVSHDEARRAVTEQRSRIAAARERQAARRRDLQSLMGRLPEMGGLVARSHAARAAWRSVADADPALEALLASEGAAARGVAAEEHRGLARAAVVALMGLGERNPQLRHLAEEHGIALAGRGAASAALDTGAMLELWSDLKALALVLVPDELVEATADPVRNLELLSAGVARVERELADAEEVFRDRTSRLERNILQAIARSKNRIARLPRAGGGSAFGSFDDVRLKVVKSEPMLAALRAITSRGDDLFATGERLEEVLPRIIAAVEAETGASLGLPASRVLDYRTYASVVVEVRRRGEAEWRSLGSTGASNGEDIGVSFVALCMILESWEARRAATAARGGGSALRLLILDEATQVDDRGLATIASFATDLGATVVLASPQVVRVAGRTTVYSLAGNARTGDSSVGVTLVRGRVVEEPEADFTLAPGPAFG